MKFYYSSRNPDQNGMIRIHGQDCKDLPDVLARVYLGMFANGNLAMQKAQKNFQINDIVICKCCNG